MKSIHAVTHPKCERWSQFFLFKQTLASVHGIPDYNPMSETYSILPIMEFNIKADTANSRSCA